jgi:hypothetical protein
VKVITASQTCGTASTQDLLLLDLLTDFDADGTEVAIKRQKPAAVINHHAIAVNAKIVCIDDHAVIRGFDGILLHHRQIEADVILLIDCFSLVKISAVIREERFHL